MRIEHLAIFLLFAPLANLNPKVNLCCRQNHAYKLHDEITTTKEHRCDPAPQVEQRSYENLLPTILVIAWQHTVERDWPQ